MKSKFKRVNPKTKEKRKLHIFEIIKQIKSNTSTSSKLVHTEKISKKNQYTLEDEKGTFFL